MLYGTAGGTVQNCSHPPRVSRFPWWMAVPVDLDAEGVQEPPQAVGREPVQVDLLRGSQASSSRLSSSSGGADARCWRSCASRRPQLALQLPDAGAGTGEQQPVRVGQRQRPGHRERSCVLTKRPYAMSNAGRRLPHVGRSASRRDLRTARNPRAPQGAAVHELAATGSSPPRPIVWQPVAHQRRAVHGERRRPPPRDAHVSGPLRCPRCPAIRPDTRRRSCRHRRRSAGPGYRRPPGCTARARPRSRPPESRP